MFCGPETVQWSVESLRKTLRPEGDFGAVVGGARVDTLDWLREELVALPQAARLNFLELTTGLPVLTPDKVRPFHLLCP